MDKYLKVLQKTISLKDTGTPRSTNVGVDVMIANKLKKNIIINTMRVKEILFERHATNLAWTAEYPIPTT